VQARRKRPNTTKNQHKTIGESTPWRYSTFSANQRRGVDSTFFFAVFGVLGRCLGACTHLANAETFGRLNNLGQEKE